MKVDSNSNEQKNEFIDSQIPQKDDLQLNHSLNVEDFFQPINSNELKEPNFEKNQVMNGATKISASPNINGKNGINSNNIFININGKNTVTNNNGLSDYYLNNNISGDFKDTNNFLNNINLQNLNIINPIYINLNGFNELNELFSNKNINQSNLINCQNDFDNKNIQNNNKNINNMNNLNNNNNNLNNIIFANNFTNINISSLNKNIFPDIFNNINNNIVNNCNYQKIDIKNINDIKDFKPKKYKNGIKNDEYNNKNQNINFYNNVNNNINNNNYKSYNPLSLKDNENQKNNSNNNMTYVDNKKNNCKKKYSLFQNETNKEKDIRDFKRFCDGLKAPLPEYICTQIGSRIMQKYLNRFPSFIITNLIEKINLFFEKIMCNIYGNYFCQKLYNISSIEQRRMILNCMKDIFINVCKSAAGAHVIQTMIESTETKEEKDIIMSYIKCHEMELALHQEGTHVLQKIIQIFTEDERQYLTDILCTTTNVNILCQDLKGISVIKRLISFNKEEINRIKLVEAFYPNVLEISKSSSGSYIIQYLIEQWGVNTSLKLIHFCILNFEAFAVNKHSANLINKIILICLKRNNLIRSYSSVNNMNNMNFNEIFIINALKGIILEPNKIINLYKNKYGKALIIKIRKLLSMEENKKLYLLIKSLENSPETKKYKTYIEIFESK